MDISASLVWNFSTPTYLRNDTVPDAPAVYVCATGELRRGQHYP